MKKFKNDKRNEKKKRFYMFFYKIYDKFSIAIDLTKVIPDKV